MRTLLLLLAATVLAACAPPDAVGVPDGHPASSDAPAASYAVEASALDPAPRPDLPAALQPDGRGPGMDHDMDVEDGTEMDHGEMDHGETGREEQPRRDEAATPAGLSDALDAYLSIQSALAADRLDGVSGHAHAFVEAVDAFAETPPEDDPHFWHERADDLATIRTYTDALADADDLADARVAFGRLSVPFADLAEALGLPDGVARFRCGMFDDAPDGGVWLQRGDSTQNPYFGSAMLTCGSPQPAPAEAGTHSHP